MENSRRDVPGVTHRPRIGRQGLETERFRQAAGPAYAGGSIDSGDMEWPSNPARRAWRC